jgi:hypothetical protein
MSSLETPNCTKRPHSLTHDLDIKIQKGIILGHCAPISEVKCHAGDDSDIDIGKFKQECDRAFVCHLCFLCVSFVNIKYHICVSYLSFVNIKKVPCTR